MTNNDHSKRRMPWWGWFLILFGLLVVARMAPPEAKKPTPPTVAPPMTAQADFERVNKSFLSAVLPCQVNYAAATALLHSRNQYDTYNAVQRAKPACLGAYFNAAQVKFSESTPQPFRDTLNEDLKECGDAYGADGVSLDSMAVVLNGDTRPSSVAAASHDIGYASTKVGNCMAKYVADVKASGVKLPDDLKKARHRLGSGHKRV